MKVNNSWGYEYRDTENEFEEDMVDITYNGKKYGDWCQSANSNYPEDLIFGRDLNELIDIGIEIGKQMEKDNPSN